MPHGVSVPDDDEQVMYVWFDALVNYISTLGWPETGGDFKSYWPGLQVCGKDNLRPQAAMWPAMLMSAGLKPERQVLVFGFLTTNGQKISKSLGNIINPLVLADKYGADALRYYLLAEIPPFEDGDYSQEKFLARYNADLANGLGNLAARLANLLEKNNLPGGLKVNLKDKNILAIVKDFDAKMAAYRFNEALQVLWEKIRASDEELSRKTPWKMTAAKELKAVLLPLAQTLLNLAYLLEPFLPEAAAKLQEQFSAPRFKKGEPLFPRL